MSAPHITGLAGLIRSANPLLTRDQVKTILVHRRPPGRKGRHRPNGLPARRYRRPRIPQFGPGAGNRAATADGYTGGSYGPLPGGWSGRIGRVQAEPRPGDVSPQSGGCCDNSTANCYLPDEITAGAGDVHLGDIGGCPFYIGKSQCEYWKHTQLIIDVVDGHGGTFSLEGPGGNAFHTRSRVFSDAG